MYKFIMTNSHKFSLLLIILISGFKLGTSTQTKGEPFLPKNLMIDKTNWWVKKSFGKSSSEIALKKLKTEIIKLT